MKKSITLFIILTLLILPGAIAPNTEIKQDYIVESIELQANGNQISWQTNGLSEKGFKVIWSRNENPTYPTRSGDKYQYYSDPETNSATLKAFDGDGIYYARVCEYLGGQCGTYSNQVEIQFGKELENGNSCSDSDGGENFYTKGTLTIKSTNETSTDYCEISENQTLLIEYLCDPLDREQTIEYKCPNGCVEGVCLKIEPTEETGPINIPEPIQCSGCVSNETCYPLGYRKEGQFCSGNFEFINQSGENTICENNFECGSNVCISGECLSQNFLQRIIAWFRALF